MSYINDMALYLAYERGYKRGCEERQQSYQDGYGKAVDMACAWLEENLKTEEERHYIHVHGFNIDEFVELFKSAMKNENKRVNV